MLPLGTATNILNIARRKNSNEIKESLAVSGQHNRLALEHIVREALHLNDKVSIVSAATKIISVQQPFTASSFASKQLLNELEVTQQDSR